MSLSEYVGSHKISETLAEFQMKLHSAFLSIILLPLRTEVGVADGAVGALMYSVKES